LTPPKIHTAMIHAAFGTCAATSPGVRRMPLPMVVPITTDTANTIPNTRSKWPFGASATCGCKPMVCCMSHLPHDALQVPTVREHPRTAP
jgi:hypothetical protein